MAFHSATRANPDRVEVRDDNDAWVATFTVNAYTVMLAGEAGALRGRAFRLDYGLPLAASPVNCTVTAFVY